MEKTYAIGIDVGGSSLKCGIVDTAGNIIYTTLVPLRDAKTEQAVIVKLAQAIEDCASKVPDFLGIGIGFPGVIDNNIVIGGADNLPGFDKLPLGHILSDVTGFANIIIDNDANLMALGEQKYGAAIGCNDVVFLTVGTGIGGAVMIDNKLRSGYKSRGAELGHVVINHGGLACACGGRGCLEAYASTTALLQSYKIYTKNLAECVDGKYVVEKYMQGEVEAITAMNEHFDYLASGIVGYINVFSPEKVVIGGGISEAGSFYIEEIDKRVRKLAIPVTIEYTEIVAASLGNKAGLLGCAANVFQRFKVANHTWYQKNK